MKFHVPPKPGSYLPCPAASLLQMLFSALMGTFSLILLLIFGIRTEEAGFTFFNPLYANLICCSLFCSAIARPATIIQTIESYDFDPRYCTAYAFVLELETVGIPLAVLALIVERAVYFSCLPLSAPLESYKERLSCVWKIFLIALPWIGGVLLAFVKTFGLLQPIVPFGEVIRGFNDTDRYYSCHLEGRSQAANSAGEGLLFSCRSGIPCVYLSVAIAVMVVYWCRAHSFGQAETGGVVEQSLQPRNSYSVFPNQESIQNASSCTLEDSAIEDSGDDTTPTINVPIKSGKVGGVRHRVCSQDEGPTQTHVPRPTTPEPNTQVVIPQISSIRQRTFSQEPTETHDAEPTSQCQLLDHGPCHPLLEPANKTHATIFIVILLALTSACVAVGGSLMVKYYGWLYETTQWLYFGLEFTAVILAYCFIPEVRRTLCCSKCTYGDQDRREQEKRLEEMSNLSTSSGYSSPTTERGGNTPYDTI